MISVKQVRDFAKDIMEEKRFLHAERTAQMSREITMAHNIDDDICNKIEIASMLHDIARDMPEELLLSKAYKKDLNINKYELEKPVLLHGKVGAEIVKSKLAIFDEDILNAIRYHTSGRVGMSIVERVVMISDVIEIGRKFRGVEELRGMAMENLNDIFKRIIENKIVYFVQCGLFVLPKTYELWNHILLKEANTDGKELYIF